MYELRQVDKHFPGVHALKAVDFEVKRGEIVGLVGENGAGKSTLMKVIYGAYQPDGGDITIDGTKMWFANPRQAMDHGIGMEKDKGGGLETACFARKRMKMS